LAPGFTAATIVNSTGVYHTCAITCLSQVDQARPPFREQTVHLTEVDGTEISAAVVKAEIGMGVTMFNRNFLSLFKI